MGTVYSIYDRRKTLFGFIFETREFLGGVDMVP